MQIAFLSCKNPIYQCGISNYTFLLLEILKKTKLHVNWLPLNSKSCLVKLSKDVPRAEYYSLQFAPFSWANKGISGKKLLKLARALEAKKLHVNFHEIWVGDYHNAKLNEKILGWFQKREILEFLKIAKPFWVTSSNSAALARLRNAGVKAEYLYLFGNIPYSHSEQIKTSNEISVVFFGTLYEKFPFDILAKNLDEISKSLDKTIHIIIMGRQRENEGLKRIKRICQEYFFLLSQRGEQQSKVISKEFQNCDLGISTTPYDILGKSGATAAMLEHGLPILTHDDEDTPKDKLFVMQEFQDQVFLLNDSLLTQKLISFFKKPRKPFFDGVAYTRKKILTTIN
jgi:hypothetical protein